MTLPEYLSTHLLAAEKHLTLTLDQGSTHVKCAYFSMIHAQVLSKLLKPATLGKYCGLFNRKC